MLTVDKLKKWGELIGRGADQPLREVVLFLLDDYVTRNPPAPVAPVAGKPVAPVAAKPVAPAPVAHAPEVK
jgi:hypothetical protein